MFGGAYDTYSLIFLLPIYYIERQKYSDLTEQLYSGIHYYKTGYILTHVRMSD